MLLLIVLGRGVAFAQFNPEDPPEPDVQPILYTVNVKASPDGIAYVSGGGEYAEGTEISLNTSLYNSSYVFKHWTKDGVKYSENTSFNYTVTDSDVTFVAVYQFQPVEPDEPETDVTYELNLSAIPSDACSFNRANGEKIEEGQQLWIEAYANQGYYFLGWFNGDTKVSTSLGFNFKMPAKKTNLVAKFEYKPAVPDEPSSGGQEDVDPGEEGVVTSVILDKTKVRLALGESVTLNAIVAPDDAPDKTVTWTTSDATVATVENGVVKGLKNGKAIITAKAGECIATCDVTVVVPVVEVVLDKTEARMNVGERLAIGAVVMPDNATDKKIVWTTSNNSIATVEDGVVTAINLGKVIITATAEADEVSATCEVNVVVPVESISLDKTTAELKEGESFMLTATVKPDYSTDKTVTWSTSDATIATVDNNGVVKAIKVGKVTITAKAGDKTATCEVTVKPVLVSGIVLDKISVELFEGETITLTATVSPDNATDKTVTWSTSDASIATVDNNGVVKAIKVGKVTITAKAGDKTATCDVTVKPVLVSGISLDKTSVELLEGETTTLKATVEPSNATDKTVTWSTSDASIATVDNNGIVKAIKVGKVTITAKAGDKTATCEVTVNPVPVDGIVLDKAEVELLEGDSITLTATVSPDNATDKTVTWSTSDATIATVDNNGVVKAIKVGIVTITAKAGDKTATCEVTVKPNDVGIDDVNVTVNVLNGDIYTIRGINVRNAGESLEGLAKGVYIKNGKKFLVK